MILEYYLNFIKLIRKFPALREAIWQTRSFFRRLERVIFVRRKLVYGPALIEEAILNRRPFVVGKMGSIEARGLHTFLLRQKAVAKNKKGPKYTPYLSRSLFLNAGVFPQDEKTFDQFGSVYLQVVENCDALHVWNVAGEAYIFRHHCRNTSLIKGPSFAPFMLSNPWSAALKDKRVLVISPFVDTIRKQYAKRETIWDDPNVLPPFELLCIRAPLSAGLVEPESASWLEALNKMKAEMDKLNFDVLLIGAGAFSLPLAVHAKSRGKVGIHLGGNLQVLFGIVGKRWEQRKNFVHFIKESWCRPSQAETPAKCKKIEDGCYW